MLKIFRLFFAAVLMLLSLQVFADNYHVFVAPGTLSETSATLLWDKQVAVTSYEVLLNGKQVAVTGKTNFTFSQLSPATNYKVQIACKGNDRSTSSTIVFKTPAKGKVYNILDYGAKADTSFKNTRAIQAAIDACTEGGTVYIPKGTFVSGALFLKSNMTLYIEEGGVLKGSTDTADYLPMIMNRFEGWEMKTYASLLNAGTLNRNGSFNVKNLRITGKGVISGGGKKLGDAQIKTSGIRSRGRLVCLMNCENVEVSNLTLTEPPSWTLHYIYSHNVTCNNLTIITYGIRNGDGIDPDSSTDSYIFNCTFDTGDDCIAIKSGKNPEGFFVAKPTVNVRVTDCDFKRGHGISIGSEMSGGVSDVLVQDCKAGNLINGMQIKGTRDRGGYVRNVKVMNCQLLKITVLTALNYNNDGAAAPEVPVFENFMFKDIDMTGAKENEKVMIINGFKDVPHHLKNLVFSNIILPEKSQIVLTDAEKVQFSNVKTVSGGKPQFIEANNTNVTY